MKKKERKEVEVQFELYCVKLVDVMLFENKNYAPLVVKDYFVLIYLFFILKHLPCSPITTLLKDLLILVVV